MYVFDRNATVAAFCAGVKARYKLIALRVQSAGRLVGRSVVPLRRVRSLAGAALLFRLLELLVALPLLLPPPEE